jgi:hypothetical protein
MSGPVTEDMLLRLAEFAGMEIAPACRAGVIRNLEILLDQAAILAQVPLNPLVEPAPVFRP